MADTKPVTALKPFTIGSHFSSRSSLDTGVRNLVTTGPLNLGPLVVNPVGFLAGILLRVTATSSGGTPVLTADAPWNLIERINFRNSKGDNLITSVTGYELYAMNKYGAQNPGTQNGFGDPKVGAGYTAAGGAIDYFMWLPLSFDLSQALGVVPATAANNNYQIEITLAATGTVWTGGVTSAIAQVQGTAYYFDSPNDPTFAQSPLGLPSASLWNVETPPATAGDKTIQSTNIGNIVRNHILILRTAAGVRTDADWPALTTFVMDNVDRLRLSKREWEYLMSRWYNLTNATKDAALGLDTGVYVIPWHALLSGGAGNVGNTRDQLLQTQTTSFVQFRLQTLGASAGTLEILTQAVATTDLNQLYSKD